MPETSYTDSVKLGAHHFVGRLGYTGQALLGRMIQDLLAASEGAGAGKALAANAFPEQI